MSEGDARSTGPREVATELVRLLSQSIAGMAEVTASVDRLSREQAAGAARVADQQQSDHRELVEALKAQAAEQHALADAVRAQTAEIKNLMGALVERLPVGPSQKAQDSNLNAQTVLLKEAAKLLGALATGAGALWGAQHLLGG